MLTKTMIAVVMSGALWVAGDAAYKQFGCCQSGCNAPPSCCSITRTPMGECCAPQSDCCEPARECCVAAKTSCCAPAATTTCCDATLVYCTRTDSIFYGCCCEVVNGEYRCLITGETSKECCCIPIE